MNLPFFRLRPGESEQDYIARMHEGYGDEWFVVPVCLASGCNRAPVVAAHYGSVLVYYCAKHKGRFHSAEYWIQPPPVAVPFKCPSRNPTFPNRTRVTP